MSELESVVQRLQRLEKQNRRIKLAGVAGLVAVVAILSMGQELQPGDVVTARAFVVAADGNEYAILDADGLRYLEDKVPVTTLGKQHLDLGGIDLSVTKAGDASLSLRGSGFNVSLAAGDGVEFRIDPVVNPLGMNLITSLSVSPSNITQLHLGGEATVRVGGWEGIEMRASQNQAPHISIRNPNNGQEIARIPPR